MEAEAEQAQREERDLRRYAEEVSRMLETLAAEVSPQDRTAIEQRARDVEKLEAVVSDFAERVAQVKGEAYARRSAGRLSRSALAQAPEMLLRKPDMEDDYHVSLPKRLRSYRRLIPRRL